MILKYIGKRCTATSVGDDLGTDEDGTSPTDIKRVFRNHGLKVSVNTDMGLRDL